MLADRLGRMTGDNDQPGPGPFQTNNRGENEMKRRTFIIAAGSAAGLAMMPKVAFAGANRIDWYTSSDQNILDFWTNIVKPKFEAANPGVTLNLVDAGDNAFLEFVL